MTKSLYSPPDSFVLSPLLALLPDRGKAGKLEELAASMYARYEKVNALYRELESTEPSDMKRRVEAEALMLRHVLDWLGMATAMPEGQE